MTEREVIAALIAIVVLMVGIFIRYRPRKKGRLLLTLFLTIKIKGQFMALTLTTVQQVKGQVNPVDRQGNPAKVEAGTVNYSSSDESVAVVEEDPDDETKFTVIAKGVGVAQITAEADADLGEGVKTISTFAAVEVLPEGAVGFGFTFAEPEDQPATGGGGNGE